MLQKIQKLLTILLLAVVIISVCIFAYQFFANQAQLTEQRIQQEAIAKKQLEAAKAITKRDSEFKSGYKAPWEK